MQRGRDAHAPAASRQSNIKTSACVRQFHHQPQHGDQNRNHGERCEEQRSSAAPSAPWCHRCSSRSRHGRVLLTLGIGPLTRDARGLAGCVHLVSARHFRSPASSLIRCGTATSYDRGYQVPVFGIEAQGSCFGFAAPFCSSSIEMPSGDRMKAMLPSRGGRLIVTPCFISRSQNA